jgi:hypothetical protein
MLGVIPVVECMPKHHRHGAQALGTSLLQARRSGKDFFLKNTVSSV